MMHTVSSSFFVTGLKRSGFNSFISMPFNATSKYPVWILFLPETHMKAHHPPPQVPASPLFMCFIMITSQHISTPLLSAKVPGLTLPTSCRSFQAIPRYPDKVCFQSAGNQGGYRSSKSEKISLEKLQFCLRLAVSIFATRDLFTWPSSSNSIWGEAAKAAALGLHFFKHDLHFL